MRNSFLTSNRYLHLAILLLTVSCAKDDDDASPSPSAPVNNMVDEHPYVGDEDVDFELTKKCNAAVNVAKAADLLLMATCPTSTYTLTKNIALTGNWTPVAKFSGVLNGNGFSITGLNISGSSNAAFISATTSAAVIKNITISGAKVLGTNYVAALVASNAGSITNTTILNSTVTGALYTGGLVGYNTGVLTSDIISGGTIAGSKRSKYIGGLVGFNDTAAISDSSATTTIAADISSGYVGGLIGGNGDILIGSEFSGGRRDAPGGTITNCFFSGSIVQKGTTIDSEVGGTLGGLVGINRSAKIVSSNAKGSISRVGSLRYSMSAIVGGLVGDNTKGTIQSSYAAVNISVDSYTASTGGLVGWGGTILTSYASGSVSGSGVLGGLVGSGAEAIYHSYATGNVSGSGFLGGLVGHGYGGVIYYSYASGKVSTSGNSLGGGLVGLGGIVYDSYATGAVSANDSNSVIGGLGGANVKLSRTYASGQVTGLGVIGGLLGAGQANQVTDSYWDTQRSGVTTSAGGLGKTTYEIQGRAPYATWSATVWTTGSGDPSIRSFADNVVLESARCPDGSAGVIRPTRTLSVWNGSDLAYIQKNLGGAYALSCDINLAGMEWEPIKGFAGVFDGSYRKISNMTITQPGNGNVGFFADISGGILITNIWLKNVSINVNGAKNVGGLIGQTSKGAVLTANSVTGTINGGNATAIGGLVGANTDKTQIYYSYSKAAISGTGGSKSCIGGLVGSNDSGSAVMASYASGRVTGTTSGGIAGCNASGSLVALTNLWDKQSSGQLTSAGLATGKTTAEMQLKSTYAAFDFVVAFTMPDSGTGYPLMACHVSDAWGNLGPSGQGCAKDM